MLDSKAQAIKELLREQSGGGRFGYVVGEGRLMDTDLPTSVHWAYVDSDDSGSVGVFELTSPDRYAAPNYDLRILRTDEHRLIASGSPESVARALNDVFRNAWVAEPVFLISPVRRLFRHLRMETIWHSPDPWLSSRVGPWADLVLRIGSNCVFRPIECNLDRMPVARHPEAYVQHYMAMRSAHRKIADFCRVSS